ncbi:MAG: hypothetical protein LBV12_09965 [Puniceicoccales bacterium]|jgi:hypothetical protein|nr:hypothetical protein [Puniceicoccales bacterium]
MRIHISRCPLVWLLLGLLWLVPRSASGAYSITVLSENFDAYGDGPVMGQGGLTPVFPAGWSESYQPFPFFLLYYFSDYEWPV